MDPFEQFARAASWIGKKGTVRPVAKAGDDFSAYGPYSGADPCWARVGTHHAHAAAYAAAASETSYIVSDSGRPYEQNSRKLE